MPAAPDPPLRVCLHQAALRLLGELLESGPPSRACAEARAGGLRVHICVSPDEETAPLGECERAVQGALAGGARVTSRALCDALRDRHSDASVKRAVASLVRRGVVANSRRAPRGYYLLGGPALPDAG